MTQITIDIPNQNDTNLVVKFLERLHLEYKISTEKTIINSEKVELEKHRQIIMNYAGMSAERAEEMLDWVKEQRQDRPLPFRD